MTLKSIELTGFKSFGKKSLISFTTPVTGIVGPNGSGKSNVVEAIRFVLGEQSMKSLRGKGGSDLIFKGSKTLTSANRASVVITFNNKNKNFSFTNSGLGVSLDYDEITLSREVFTDGSNRYSINGTEVRLKDIIDLLASVNIGSSGHHIISQGEADRVLNASNKDRKAMIEDALGLRIYQYRIRESERKLEKTVLNMKEVASLRREIAPHLNFLKKQVQIVEKAKVMREELRELYKGYLSAESTYINKETIRVRNIRQSLNEKQLALDAQIEKLQNEKGEQKESENSKEIKENESKLIELRRRKDELARSIGRIEGILESLKNQKERSLRTEEKVIPASEWKTVVEDVDQRINEALETNDLPKIISILRLIKEKINSLYNKTENNNSPANLNIENELNEMNLEKENINSRLNEIINEEENILSDISILREKEKEREGSLRDNERLLYELLREKNEIVSNLHSLGFEEEKIVLIKNNYETELAEAGVLIGRDVISFVQTTVDYEVVRQTQEDMRRKIERIKIKLEDIGSGTSSDVMKEYEETEERDKFLAKELDDLKNSIDSLNTLIEELKETLDNEFKVGVTKINHQFQDFFVLMFGGGKASLSVTMEYKKPRKGDGAVEDIDEEVEEEKEVLNGEENSLGFERGIEIDVSLPHKKVKDLNMLSGGERSLTSIALLFAISQVNPPPFLVLDETDAALDEANSRKYGNMLENLSKYSQLVLVTHNRETMSRAQVLYGVTMGSEGVSKLLSIHLEDATTYAK
jgi:chromosome segregation protein